MSAVGKTFDYLSSEISVGLRAFGGEEKNPGKEKEHDESRVTLTVLAACVATHCVLRRDVRNQASAVRGCGVGSSTVCNRESRAGALVSKAVMCSLRRRRLSDFDRARSTPRAAASDLETPSARRKKNDLHLRRHLLDDGCRFGTGQDWHGQVEQD
jgi:hypothetical protein